MRSSAPQAAVVGLDAWMGALAFSGQIFFDFAGYSTVAIGTALCLGFSIPENFRYPYAAIGFSDFWKRWHISLSYLASRLLVYSAGREPQRERVRTYVNLMFTMLLGGLWHGASWTFVAWGMLHGLYLWAEKAIRALVGERVTYCFRACSPDPPGSVDFRPDHGDLGVLSGRRTSLRPEVSCDPWPV